MKTIYIFLQSTVLGCFLSVSLFADIPPEPSPEEECSGKVEGENCRKLFRGGFATCQLRDGRLLCMKPEQNKTDGSIKKAIDAENVDAKIETNDLQGCTNFAMSPSGLLSLMSVLFGVYLFMRNRQK